MKKIFSILTLISCVILLTGCSGSLQETMSTRLNELITADQTHEQGFVVTSEMVLEHYYEDSNGIDMSTMGLTAIPDFCTLLSQEDAMSVWHLDLSDNAIKIVDQDLSCFVALKTLNLSYNEIEVVKTLGALPTLIELKLHKNQLTSTSSLPFLPSLERLNLGYNQLKEAVGLDQYENIKVLELYHNEIEELVGIENMQKLEELKVEFNNIKDFGFFETLKEQGLEIMTAKGNEVKDSFLDELRDMNNEYIESLREEYQIGGTASQEVVVENSAQE